MLDLIPEDARVFGRRESTRSDDVVLAVSTGIAGITERWVGIARAGVRSLRGALSGAFSTPNPSRICVVARGDAYLIDVVAPERYQTIDTAGPVLEVRALIKQNLLLLVTPWTITAVGEHGVCWRTRRLAIEGVRLDEADGNWLAGVADPDSDESRDFAVDLTTGRHEGGVPLC